MNRLGLRDSLPVTATSTQQSIHRGGVILACLMTALLLFIVIPSGSVRAQEAAAADEATERSEEGRRGRRGPGGRGNLTPEQIEQFRAQFRERGERGGRPRIAQTNNSEEAAEETEGEEEEKTEKEEEKKDDETPTTVRRPTDRSVVPDPNRPRLKPDDNGLVQFNYLGQGWSDVLQDYADAAGLSFDWQELPADQLNLTTQRRYTLAESRDLLNRHLLARGFTLIEQGEVLTAVKISKLDPSMVPRIEADDLEDHSPYDFVRVRYDLPMAMDAAKAAEDVKLLLSSHAKVTPLLATKRLLVIDSVANQRSVRDLLYSEQMAASQDIKPTIYQIQHRRADYVADQVMIILGMDPKRREAPQEMQQQQLQMVLQQMQRGGGRGDAPDLSKLLGRDEPQVFISVDRRYNTMLVNAPPDVMPVIERTIKELDIPDGNIPEGGGGASPGARFSTQRYLEKYQTVSANAESLVTALQEIGNLDPLTQLHTDTGGKTIFATASAADHETIRRMIDTLDGSGRRPEVIWLPKRLPADQVAGSISALIVGEKEEDSSSPFAFFGRGRRGGQQQESEQESSFRVLPDVENNRLIVWATENELREVKGLIEKLSESGDGAWAAGKVRVLDNLDAEKSQRLLEQLRATWTGDNPLEIDLPAFEELPSRGSPADEDPDEQTPSEDPLTRLQLPSPAIAGNPFRLVQVTVPADEQAAEEEEHDRSPVAGGAPPIKITVNEAGNLVITSDDTFALDQFQELVEQLAPPQPKYHWFKLRYFPVDDMTARLKEFFADELAQDTSRNRSWWMPQESDKPATLGRRPLLRFIDDTWTNTLIVANANPSQLETIEALIKRYDQPAEREAFHARVTETIKVRYSRASEIAKSLKEVYADLLSSKDKEFEGRGRQQQSFGSAQSRRYAFGDAVSRGTENSPVVITFEGALSIGVDEISNSLIVSARAEVIESIKQTVKLLDQAAQPDTVVSVHEINSRISPEELRRVLSEAMGDQAAGASQQRGGRQDQRGRGGRRR